MRQAEAVVARAPVVSWDVDALMDAASIVFGYTFVYICREKEQQNLRAGSQQHFETQKHIYFLLGEKEININLKQRLAAKLSVWVRNKIQL